MRQSPAQQRVARSSLRKTELGVFGWPMRFQAWCNSLRSSWKGLVLLHGGRAVVGLMVAALLKAFFVVPTNAVSVAATVAVVAGVSIGGLLAFALWSLVLVGLTTVLGGFFLSVWIASPQWWARLAEQWNAGSAVPIWFVIGFPFWLLAWSVAAWPMSKVVDTMFEKLWTKVAMRVASKVSEEENAQYIASMREAQLTREEADKHITAAQAVRSGANMSTRDRVVVATGEPAGDEVRDAAAEPVKSSDAARVNADEYALLLTSDHEIPGTGDEPQAPSPGNGVDLGPVANTTDGLPALENAARLAFGGASDGPPAATKSEPASLPAPKVSGGSDVLKVHVTRQATAIVKQYEVLSMRGDNDQFILDNIDYLLAMSIDEYDAMQNIPFGEDVIAISHGLKNGSLKRPVSQASPVVQFLQSDPAAIREGGFDFAPAAASGPAADAANEDRLGEASSADETMDEAKLGVLDAIARTARAAAEPPAPKEAAQEPEAGPAEPPVAPKQEVPAFVAGFVAMADEVLREGAQTRAPAVAPDSEEENSDETGGPSAGGNEAVAAGDGQSGADDGKTFVLDLEPVRETAPENPLGADALEETDMPTITEEMVNTIAAIIERSEDDLVVAAGLTMQFEADQPDVTISAVVNSNAFDQILGESVARKLRQRAPMIVRKISDFRALESEISQNNDDLGKAASKPLIDRATEVPRALHLIATAEKLKSRAAELRLVYSDGPDLSDLIRLSFGLCINLTKHIEQKETPVTTTPESISTDAPHPVRPVDVLAKVESARDGLSAIVPDDFRRNAAPAAAPAPAAAESVTQPKANGSAVGAGGLAIPAEFKSAHTANTAAYFADLAEYMKAEEVRAQEERERAEAEARRIEAERAKREELSREIKENELATAAAQRRAAEENERFSRMLAERTGVETALVEAIKKTKAGKHLPPARFATPEMLNLFATTVFAQGLHRVIAREDTTDSHIQTETANSLRWIPGLRALRLVESRLLDDTNRMFDLACQIVDLNTSDVDHLMRMVENNEEERNFVSWLKGLHEQQAHARAVTDQLAELEAKDAEILKEMGEGKGLGQVLEDARRDANALDAKVKELTAEIVKHVSEKEALNARIKEVEDERNELKFRVDGYVDDDFQRTLEKYGEQSDYKGFWKFSSADNTKRVVISTITSAMLNGQQINIDGEPFHIDKIVELVYLWANHIRMKEFSFYFIDPNIVMMLSSEASRTQFRPVPLTRSISQLSNILAEVGIDISATAEA